MTAGNAYRDAELCYDRIPHAVRVAAIEADFLASLEAPRSPVRLRVKAYKPEGIIDRMAETMRRVARLGRPVHRADLAQAGFSTSEIDRHAENARALAARRIEAAGEQLTPVEIPVVALLIVARQMRGQAPR